MIFPMAALYQSHVVSFEEARRIIENQASRLHPHGRELLNLLAAAGRVLAEPILADRDFPPFPRATRDGYALRSRDAETLPINLEVVGEIKAGAPSGLTGAVEAGKAYAIMTGAALPEGADAVVMLEHTRPAGNRVQLERLVSAGENVVPRGAEAKRGQQLLSPGTFLDAAAIALAAAVGRPRLLVYDRPQVAVLATVDELVDLDAAPGPVQIRNSNSYSLGAQIQANGADPVLLPIAPDQPGRLRELLGEGLESDLLLVSGGVSMGKYDLVEPMLAELKAEFFFTGAQIQPGRPVVFARIPHSQERQPRRDEEPYRYFFGLPGNPVSTMVTFELFAKPMLQALAGTAPQPLIFTCARLKSVIRTQTGLKRFLPALISGRFDDSEVELAGWQ